MSVGSRRVAFWRTCSSVWPPTRTYRLPSRPLAPCTSHSQSIFWQIPGARMMAVTWSPMCRAFAQLVISELLERYPSECGVEQNRVLAQMQQFLALNKDLQAAKQTIGPCISRFDTKLACRPLGIFCTVRDSHARRDS